MKTYTIIPRSDYLPSNMDRVYLTLKTFGVPVTLEERHITDQFFSLLDFADQLIDDNIVAPGNTAEHILNFIVGKIEILSPDTPLIAAENFTFVRNYIVKMNLQKQFEGHIREILRIRNISKRTLKHEEYISLAYSEARQYAEVGMLFLPERCLTADVRRFLNQMNIVARIGDNLLDLKEDYAKGQIIFRPSLLIKIKLRLSLFKAILKIFLYYPKKIEAFGLGKRYLRYSLLKTYRTA